MFFSGEREKQCSWVLIPSGLVDFGWNLHVSMATFRFGFAQPSTLTG